MWFRLAKGDEAAPKRDERTPREELPVLVLFDGWQSLFRDRVVPWRIALSEKVRAQLERELLPAFVAAQRWYAAKGETLKRVSLIDHVQWGKGPSTWLITLAGAELSRGEPQTYFLPLAVIWEDAPEERMRAVQEATIARVRQQGRVGVLADAFADEDFCRAIAGAIDAGDDIRCARGTIRFMRTRTFDQLTGGDASWLGQVRSTGAQSSNTVLVLGEKLLLKAPSRHHSERSGRFLSETVSGSRAPSGVAGDDAVTPLLQGLSSRAMRGVYAERAVPGAGAAARSLHSRGGARRYLALIRTLGKRTAARCKSEPAIHFDRACRGRAT
jgi:maltose alpha-D-glucosyltransferase/alpha-amylase